MLPWQVAASDLLLGEELGEGGQATVVSGMWNGVAVAVKQPRAPRGASKKNLTNATAHLDSFAHAVRREARALHRVRHPNVVKLHGLCFELASEGPATLPPGGNSRHVHIPENRKMFSGGARVDSAGRGGS